MYNSLPYLTFPTLLPISRNKKNWAQVLNLYSSIHPFIQQILSTSYVPDVFPGIGTTEMLFSCSVVSDSCDSMICSTLGFLVLHHLPELAQTHVHWVSDAVQPSHPDNKLNWRTVVRMKELIYVMCIQQKLAHRKCSINVSRWLIPDCRS